MIPDQIILRNFLSFSTALDGGPVILNFEGSKLWSISGDNGAGKTAAISDALTYAFFDQHRGGKQGDVNLIHHGANVAEVSAVFRLGAQRYRIVRTIRRPTRPGQSPPKTQSLEQWTDAADWEPVPGIDGARDLEPWVREQLGMDYNTFTASTLLLQGRGDVLLTAGPADRFRVLSSLIDLAAYDRLSRLAGSRKKMQDARIEDLQRQLDGLELVTDDQVATAQKAVSTLTATIEDCEEQSRQAERRVSRVQAYHAKCKDLADIVAELAGFAELEAEALHLEAAEAQRVELERLLPKLDPALVAAKTYAKQEAHLSCQQTRLAGLDLDALARTAKVTADQAAKMEAELDKCQQDLRQSRAAHTVLIHVVERLAEMTAAQARLAQHGTPEIWQERIQQATEAWQQVVSELVEPARQAAERTRDELRRDKTNLGGARSQRGARAAAGAEGVCSRCGQPVDAAHLTRELAELDSTITQLSTRVSDLERQCEEQEADLRAKEAEATRLQQTVTDRKDKRIQANGLADSATEAADRFARALAGLSAEWPALAAALDGATLDEAQARLASLHEDEDRLTDLEADLKRAVDEAKEAADTARQALDEAEALRQKVCTAERTLNMLRDLRAAKLQDLPQPWHGRVLAGDEGVEAAAREELARQREAAARYPKLIDARKKRDGLQAQRKLVAGQLTAVPDEDRIAAEDAEAAAEAARRTLFEWREEHTKAKDRLAELEQRRDERRRLTTDLGTAQQLQRRYQRLATLLGRTGIQAELLTEALKGIERLANESLATLASGRLTLRLQPDKRDEIAILAIDQRSGDEPRDVRYLSGGQRFRVAVALALGIGQYLGRGRGSVQTLIIDEGFGALDDEGRQGMIDELQHLTRYLDRVIFVSHQEELLDCALFPHGYRLRKEGHQTVVERVGWVDVVTMAPDPV